ncbi:hypothetical protein L1049_012491 [Liquidambar formosana]|uniref:Uncharacterized protein n=1 Tax=Liquidambar formosana TaxID=63359 RepID=A0AAP0N529_LIQFO
MGGGMEANKNRWIEEWGSARENLEHNFRWTRRNFALVGIFGIAIPVLVYKGIVKEFATEVLAYRGFFEFLLCLSDDNMMLNWSTLLDYQLCK